MVLFLLIHWLFFALIVWVGGCCDWSLFCYALLSGLHFGNWQSSGRDLTISVFLLALLIVFGALCLFLTVTWDGLQCVIVAFPGHILINV